MLAQDQNSNQSWAEPKDSSDEEIIFVQESLNLSSPNYPHGSTLLSCIQLDDDDDAIDLDVIDTTVENSSFSRSNMCGSAFPLPIWDEDLP
jgi:hypothetical protein